MDGREVAKGEKGVAGPPGPRGIKGEAGKVAAEERNWKQCESKKADSRECRCWPYSGERETIFFIQRRLYWI